MKILQKKKGITLIALVITIVIISSSCNTNCNRRKWTF